MNRIPKGYTQAGQEAWCRQLLAQHCPASTARYWIKGTKANDWRGREVWCVWRPDICPHITRTTYETEAKAQAAADRINRKLYPNLVPA